MKKIFLLSVILTSCEPSNEELRNRESKGQFIPPNEIPYGISVTNIGKCQYIYFKTVYGVSIVHAEDCTNPIHAK